MTNCDSEMQAGGIMGRRFQPYESHIPYLLQLKVQQAGNYAAVIASMIPLTNISSRASL